jgi:hypothetical protein
MVPLWFHYFSTVAGTTETPDTGATHLATSLDGRPKAFSWRRIQKKHRARRKTAGILGKFYGYFMVV